MYLNRTGIPWRYLPHDFPPHPNVYSYFAAWSSEGIFIDLNYQLTDLARDRHGRPASPTASIMDIPNVKTSTNVPIATQGTDAAKKIVGRKRGIVTDTLGLLLFMIVPATSVSDDVIDIYLLNQTSTEYPTVTKTWVDADFKVKAVEHGPALGIDVEIVTKDPQLKGFNVVKHRWVVERVRREALIDRVGVRDLHRRPVAAGR